jgi:hypothetical protein
VPFRGAFGQRLEANHFQFSRNRIVNHPWWTHINGFDVFQDLLPAAAAEWPRAGEHFVKDNTQTENIGSPVD